MTDDTGDKMKKTGTLAAALLAGAMMGGGAVALKGDGSSRKFMQATCNHKGSCEADLAVLKDGKEIGIETVKFPSEKWPVEKLPDDVKACLSAIKSGSFLKLSVP